MNKKSILLTSIVLVLCTLLLSPLPAKAEDRAITVFNVDTFQDMADIYLNGVCSAGQPTNGPCSLRAAVTEAYKIMQQDKDLHIKLPYGTYTLTLNDSSFEDGYYGDLDFKTLPAGFENNKRTVTIEGTDPQRPSVINANGIDRVLQIGFYYNIILKNLIITGGRLVATTLNEARGGGIYKRQFSTLELNKVRITNNVIVCDACQYTLGGGISSTDQLTINNSEIDHNTATIGSAIEQVGRYYPLYIRNSSIHSNYMDKGRVVDGSGLLLNLVNSTVEGEIHWMNGGDVWIQNSTLYSTPYNAPDPTAILANIRTYCYNCSVNLKIKNSILITQNKDNPAITHGPNCYFDHTMISAESLGGNVFSDDTCPFRPDLRDIRVTNPLHALLGPLCNNGGPTPTRALLPGSPAINRLNELCRYLSGNPCNPVSSMLLEDQRGADRDSKCDSGAYEFWLWHQAFLPIIAK